MGLEVRRVPRDWEHPTDSDYSTPGPWSREHPLAFQPPRWRKWRPLNDEDWAHAMRGWLWTRIKHAIKRAALYPFALLGWADPEDVRPWSDDVEGAAPDCWNYRPRWKSRPTHYQLYEHVSEGTPKSPICATPEELARWCAAQTNEVWVNTHMDYDGWLRFIRKGWAPSGIYTPERGFESGAVAMARE